MKKRIKYANEPLGNISVVRDFLPPPAELAFKEEGVKVTMTLSKSSVDFFKRAARKYHAPYQQMIRRLIDAYATHQGGGK
jgi:predicted DNA binding CopG/RHH family protein